MSSFNGTLIPWQFVLLAGALSACDSVPPLTLQGGGGGESSTSTLTGASGSGGANTSSGGTIDTTGGGNTGGLGGIGGSSGGSDTNVVCADGLTTCGPICVDTRTDPNHCGGCDSACPSGQCTASVCVPVCAADETLCDMQCTNLSLDANHCGDCGTACAVDQTCQSGACVLNCGPETVACGAVCAAVDFDPFNCGGCGIVCGPSSICSAGQCLQICEPGMVDCDGACTDLSQSPQNCGQCGLACAPGQTCIQGQCGGCTTHASCGVGALCQAGSCVSGGPPSGPEKGLRFWIDAAVGVVKDGSNHVSLWADQSGFGNDALQATPSAQPLWSATAGPHATKPAVTFPAYLDHIRTNPDYGIHQPETVFLVINQNDFVFWAGSSGGMLMDGWLYDSGFLYQAYGAPNLTPCAQCPGYAINTWGETPLHTWLLIVISYNGAASWLAVNDKPKHTADLGSAPMSGVTLGCAGPSGGVIQADTNPMFSEVLIYSSALAQADIDSVKAYLNAKYQLY